MESQEIGLCSICFASGLRETLSATPLPQYLHFSATLHPNPPPPPLLNPCSHPITEACRTEPQSFYMSSKVSPCDAESPGWMSAECSIKKPPAKSQQQQQQQRDPMLFGASPSGLVDIWIVLLVRLGNCWI